MGKAEILTSLRSLIGNSGAVEKKFWEAPSFPAGVARGILAELTGNACNEWLIEFFKMNPEHLILWCEHGPKIHPTAIRQRGVDLSRIKFLTSTEDLQQPLRIALESGHYPFIVAPNRFEQIPIFQKLHLLAEKVESTVFLISEKKLTPAWPISLQLEISNLDGVFQIETHRQRHGITQ